ncbi:MAG TPA: alpha/beta hydrolase [Casimicrobiaceae bacterium]|nr:alpha/beta hydrolase [Casimicrobiaceae bacterium]
MPVDPELDAFNARVAAAVPRAAVATPQARRARLEATAQRFPYPPDDVARSDHWITLPGREILVRVYRPRSGTLPAMLYLHGGGWVAGSVMTHDGAAAALARDASIVVASVQYRRAPENPCPAPNDDAYAAWLWLAEHAPALDIDPRRIGIGGDSAGAHLAIGACIEARDRRGPRPVLQLLIYPVIEPDFETPSYREHAVTGTLTRADMIDYWNDYLPSLQSSDPRALPARASAAGLPAAHIVVAGIDPLRDEGLRFAARLVSAGVSTALTEGDTLTHGFLRAAPYVAAARAVQERFGRAIGRALHAVDGNG